MKAQYSTHAFSQEPLCRFFEKSTYASIADMDSSEITPQRAIARWLKSVMDSKGWTAPDWHEASGVAASTIQRAVRNDYKFVTSTKTLRKLANAANVPLPSFDGDFISQKRDHEQSAYGTMRSVSINDNVQNIPLRPLRVTHNVPVLGKAEAGAFRAMFNDNETAETYIPIDMPEYEGVYLFAYEVTGPSMNQVFREGDRVICKEFDANDLRDRDYVILRDTRGSLAEISIKEFRIGDKGQWKFWPRSDDPRHQTPITIPERNDYQQDGMEIIAIVLFEAPAPIKRVGRLAVRRS